LKEKKLFDVTKGSFVFRKKSKREREIEKEREREIEKEIDDVKTFFLPTGFNFHVDSQQIVLSFSNECFFVF
jgi:hypothetical protein